MRYSFKSQQPHNLKSIFIHRSYKLLWPVVVLLLIQYIFPKSKFATDNWHLYTFLFIEIFNFLLILTSDSINEIIVEKSKQIIEIYYYNIYQGNMEEKFSFANITVNMETSRKNEVSQITFYVKKGADIIIKKDKDNFSAQDIESLKELLYQITTPKKN